MKVFCLFMVSLWSFGMVLYSKEVKSDVQKIPKSQFTWHTEESFHAHDLSLQINASSSAEEEEDDETNDEDELNLKCVFPKKEIQFTSTDLGINLVSIHPKSRLLKPFLKPQFTPPDLMLIA